MIFKSFKQKKTNNFNKKIFFIKKNIPYAIFVQNGYAMNSTSDQDKLINSYRKAKFILSYSKDITQCIKTVFNIDDSKIIKINISVNSITCLTGVEE